LLLSLPLLGSHPDQDGDTFCIKEDLASASFKFNGFQFTRVNIGGDGMMTSENIRDACTRIGQKPVCDHNSYTDGQCVIAQNKAVFHFS
jgi:hypothetical protein